MARRPDLKQHFVAGVLLLLPLAVTVYLLQLLAGWTVSLVDPLVQGTRLATYTANNVIIAQGLAVVAVLVFVTGLGALAQWSVGMRLFGSMGRVVTFIPLVDTVYSSVRQVASALVEGETRYDRVVLIEYPREGVYCVGLVTAAGPAEVNAVTGESTVTVYLPNSPNPTGGRLLLVPTADVHEVDMSVRRGLRLLVTTGMGSDALSGADPETARPGAATNPAGTDIAKPTRRYSTLRPRGGTARARAR